MSLPQRTLPYFSPIALALAQFCGSPSVHAQVPGSVTTARSAAGTSEASSAAQSPGVEFDLSRVVIRGASVGTLNSRSLLTSVDTIGSSIQDTAAGSNYELFSRLPGIQTTVFNQGTTSGKPSMRGFNGEGEVNAVKLLIDGIPSNSNDGNMPYLDMLVPLELQAITAVRGTNDARFGLHNIAGNLEATTRLGGNASEARVGLGLWGQTDLQLAVDREQSGLTQNYAIGVRHADGWRDHSASDRHSLSGKWGWKVPGSSVSVQAGVRWHRTDAEEPGYLEAKDAYTRPRMSYAISATDGGLRDMTQAFASVDGGSPQALQWKVLAYRNTLDDQRWVRFSATASQQERVTDEVHTGVRALFSWKPSALAALGAWIEGGVDAERQDNISRRYNTTLRSRVATTRDQAWSLDTTGGFVQAVVRPMPTLKIVPGYRIDRLDGQFSNILSATKAGINDFGTLQSPKLSAVWDWSPGWSLYGNWGKTFQVGVGAASFKIPPRTRDLSASINEGVELGVKWVRRDQAEARVALWQQTATNEVYRDLNNPSGDSINIGATRRRGMDIQTRVHFSPQWEAYATLGLQEALITAPNPAAPTTLGKEVDHTPRHVFTAGTDWRAGDALRLSAWVQGQGNYWLERTNALTGKFGGYTIASISATIQVSPSTEVQAVIANLFDGQREYVWWDGAKTLHSAGEPRSAWLSLRTRF